MLSFFSTTQDAVARGMKWWSFISQKSNMSQKKLEYCQVNVFIYFLVAIVVAWTTNYKSIVTQIQKKEKNNNNNEHGVQQKGDKIKVAKEQNLLFTVEPCILLLSVLCSVLGFVVLPANN